MTPGQMWSVPGSVPVVVVVDRLLALGVDGVDAVVVPEHVGELAVGEDGDHVAVEEHFGDEGVGELFAVG
jgi:hypothetical protein